MAKAKRVEDMSREELLAHIECLLTLLHLPYMTAQFVQGGRSRWERAVQKAYAQSDKDIDD